MNAFDEYHSKTLPIIHLTGLRDIKGTMLLLSCQYTKRYHMFHAVP